MRATDRCEIHAREMRAANKRKRYPHPKRGKMLNRSTETWRERNAEYLREKE